MTGTPFDTHEIVSTVEADGFCSWLMMRRHEDGSWDRTFWARITAAEGKLAVVGDFDPTIFAHGPTDPRACVRWIGSRSDVDGYRAEKASIGMGAYDVWRYDTDLAMDDLRELMADADQHGETYSQALQAGLSTAPDFDGYLGVHEILRAVMDVDYDMVECVGHIGRRIKPSVTLAVQAAHRAERHPRGPGRASARGAAGWCVVTIERMHVRPKLRIVYAVAGRPDVLTRKAAYHGALLAAVSKRCDCYHGSTARDDPSDTCAYHDAISSQRHGHEPEYDGADRRLAALRRLSSIHQARDAASVAAATRPVLDLSHMREDELQAIAVAIDWHLANGQHKPARRK